MTPKIPSSGAAWALSAMLAFAASHAFAWGAKKKEASSPTAQTQSQSEQTRHTLNPKVSKALRAAQDVLRKEDWEGAFARVQEAQAVPGKTPYDDFQIAEMLGYVELKRQHFPEATAAFERSLNAGFLTPEQTQDHLKLLAQLYLQLKDYTKGVDYARRAVAATPQAGPELDALLGQGEYLAGNYRPAAEAMARAADKARKVGKPIVESWLQLELSGYGQLNDEAGVIGALQQLAIEFPGKSYLQDLFERWRRVQGDGRSVLNLYRLMFALNRLDNGDAYLKMAQLALDMGLPGEAVKVLEKGTTAKAYADDVEQEQARRKLVSARALAVTDKKALAELEATASAKDGEDNVQLGVALWSYEQYAKAVEALQRGLTLGNLKRPDEAQILLGHALLKLNRREEAQKTFAAVDEAAKLHVIARLWEVYTREPSPLGAS